LYVPAVHNVQTENPEADQEPAGQLVHAVRLSDTPNLPAGQTSQVFEVCPGTPRYWPTVQFVQSFAAVPPVAFLHEPAVQLVHSVRPAYNTCQHKTICYFLHILVTLLQGILYTRTYRAHTRRRPEFARGTVGAVTGRSFSSISVVLAQVAVRAGSVSWGGLVFSLSTS
jgi:hypothetical protein